MGEMITKPDANPILFAVANFFVLGALGYFLMGQKGKAIAAIVYVLICHWVLVWLFGIGTLLGIALQIAFAYDAYQLGQKLQAGESIGEKESALGFLGSLPGFK